MFEANTPQELIYLIEIPKKYRVALLDGEVKEFYSKENFFPRVHYVIEKMHSILTLLDESEAYSWELHIKYIIKYGLVKGGHYKYAYQIFHNEMEEELVSYLDDERTKSVEGFDYSYNLMHIAIEAIIQYNHLNSFSNSLLNMWKFISPEELIHTIIFPVDIIYESKDWNIGDINNCVFYHIPSVFEFTKAYIEIIKIIMDMNVPRKQFNRHIHACLKLILDEVQYFSSEECSYLLLLQKLSAILKQNTDVQDLIFLTRWMIELNLGEFNAEGYAINEVVLSDKEIKNLAKCANKVLKWSSENSIPGIIKEYWDLIKNINDIKKTALLIEFCSKLTQIRDKEIINKIAGDAFKSFDPMKFLFEQSEYGTIAKIYFSHLSIEGYYFEFAFSLKKSGYIEEAKKVYSQAIENGKETNAIFNNLGVIYEEHDKEYETALSLFERAISLAPNEVLHKNNKKRIENLIKEKKNKNQTLKDIYFKKTTKYQKSILFALYRLSDQQPTFNELSEATRQKESYVKKNLEELLNLELIIPNNNSYILEPIIEELVSNYVEPKLERQIIRVDKASLYRPIFYHESEINLYHALIDLFPQHFIFPNISLKTIIDVEKIKELVSQEHVNYLFMAHVDYAIISTTTYTPVLAIEKDSTYHETDSAAIRDERKNLIFQMSGIPLVRVKFNSNVTLESLKKQVRDVTKELINTLKSDEQDVRLLHEIDVRNFGALSKSDYDLDELQEDWAKIVGSGIAQKSKIDNVEGRTVSVLLSSELEAIISMSKEQIEKKFKIAHPLISEITYHYY
ncbi:MULTISPECIES: DUF2726 domain-containing protein [Paenibacillus]|uniref:DUF2726 domain-containing protein n=1 Tax=Paenibacillus TaxID=44249 RepID=UPI00096E13F0|nr:DUF2726 domain-containing protein [Paenibacillus odorifer]OME44141.1 hypothetical protein BSK58_04425 [Paenibacillus odorifer]